MLLAAWLSCSSLHHGEEDILNLALQHPPLPIPPLGTSHLHRPEPWFGLQKPLVTYGQTGAELATALELSCKKMQLPALCDQRRSGALGWRLLFC